MEDKGYNENTSANITNSTFDSTLPGQPQQFEDEAYNDGERLEDGENGEDGGEDGDGDGYDTVIESESPGEKEKGNLQGDLLYDINNPMEKELMEQQLQFEASCKNNLLKVAVQSTKGGSTYSTAHNSPADSYGATPTDGAVGGVGGTTVFSSTTTSTSTTNPFVPNTNVGTIKKVGPTAADIIIKKQYQLEDASMGLLQQVLREEIVDRDQTIK